MLSGSRVGICSSTGICNLSPQGWGNTYGFGMFGKCFHVCSRGVLDDLGSIWQKSLSHIDLPNMTVFLNMGKNIGLESQHEWGENMKGAVWETEHHLEKQGYRHPLYYFQRRPLALGIIPLSQNSMHLSITFLYFNNWGALKMS